MPTLDEHPTVQMLRQRPPREQPPALEAATLRAVCLELGADDVGFVSIDRPELADQRDDILKFFPHTRTLISLVLRMNAEPIRNPARSVANLEFHHTGEEVNDVARQIVSRLTDQGYRAINPAMGFPMEMTNFPGKMWVVSHKPVAVAAGLGQMGLHRNVIHPRFGNFILLGTVLVDAPVTEQSQPIEYNPCVSCKLCVAACPVGAIGADGAFNFASCYTHNYREFMGGFNDWVENVVESKSARDYRSRVTDGESVSMWQSLSFGPNYKAAYCLSVCPAGEEVMAPFLQDRPGFVREVVRPLQEKPETIYVQANSDAEDYVPRRFPHKPIKRVGSVLRVTSIDGFIAGMQHIFQPGKSRGLSAVYHFRLTGAEPADCTVTIHDQKITVVPRIEGRCDLRVTADSRSWLRFLRKEVSIVWLLMTLRVRPWGDPRLLVKFGRCFP